MKFRDVYLTKQKVLGVSGTEIIDLDIATPIFSIEIIVDGKYDTAQDYDDHPLYKDISKIEIVDGATVLWSLSMIQAEALNAYELKCMPYMDLVSKKGTATQEKFVIHFGRHMYDQELMFDPTKYTNPQLKVTYAFVVDASHWAANEQKLTVVARTVEDVPVKPIGFLMAKEIYTWTTATAGDETIDMPRDYPYRLIMGRKYISGERVDEGFVNLKLSCDMDAYVPFDIKGSHLTIMNENRFGLLRLTQRAMKKHNEIVYSPLADVNGANVVCDTDYRTTYAKALDAEKITISLCIPPAASTDASATEGIDRDLIVTAFGLQPHHTLCYPFGDLQTIEHFFDPTPYKSVRLIVTQGGTSGTGEIVLQQLKKY